MVKYATVLRLGTAESESILRRFTRENVKHPTYQALQELSKGGEVATNRIEDQEISILSLHLLQICLVYINTLMIQNVLVYSFARVSSVVGMNAKDYYQNGKK